MVVHIFKLLIVTIAVTMVMSSDQHKARYPTDSVPPIQVYRYTSDRTTRLIRNYFTQLRRSYTLLDEIEQREIENLGWKPPYVSYIYTDSPNKVEVIVNGTAGEDFLYNIEKMIRTVDKIAEDAGSSWRVDGWSECPEPGDLTWPVPPLPEIFINDLEYYNYLYEDSKKEGFYWSYIYSGQQYLYDHFNLQGLTLGELGVKLEFELFTYFLMRFSGYNPIGYRKQSYHPTAHVDGKWDDEDYDFLSDFYSAHVNPHFWKIAGWVKEQVYQWKIANGIGEITWISKWEGGPIQALPDLWRVAKEAEERRNQKEKWWMDSEMIELFKFVAGCIAVLSFFLSIILLAYVCILRKRLKRSAVVPIRSQEVRPLRRNSDNSLYK